MDFQLRWDDAQLTDHCYNIWLCEECGMILKDSVWEDKGKVWIELNNKVTIE